MIQSAAATLYGGVAGYGDYHVTFGAAFPHVCYGVTCTAADKGWIGTWNALTFIVTGVTTTGFNVAVYGSGAPSDYIPSPIIFYWTAVGG